MALFLFGIKGGDKLPFLPDNDIAQFLHNAGIVEYDQPVNSNIFLGKPRPPKIIGDNVVIPDKSAWITQNSGPPPEYVFGHDHKIYRVGLQLLIRGESNKRLDTQAFAQDIYDNLNGTIPSGYFHCMPQQSGPIDVGLDQESRPMFSINVILTYESTV